MNLITPQQIEETAQAIVEYWDNSELPDADKTKILEMIKDFYTDENQHVFQQYLAQLCERTIDRRVPKTSFESDDRRV